MVSCVGTIGQCTLSTEYEPKELGPAIQIPVSKHRTYVDPTTYASPDEAIEEFAKEIEPKMLRLDAEIGAGVFLNKAELDKTTTTSFYLKVGRLSSHCCYPIMASALFMAHAVVF